MFNNTPPCLEGYKLLSSLESQPVDLHGRKIIAFFACDWALTFSTFWFLTRDFKHFSFCSILSSFSLKCIILFVCSYAINSCNFFFSWTTLGLRRCYFRICCWMRGSVVFEIYSLCRFWMYSFLNEDIY